MAPLQLEALTRTALGRGAKAVRKQKLLPAVMYGHGVESRPVSVSVSAFKKVYSEVGSSALIDVNVDGAKAVKVIIKDVQVDPITMEPLHADLHQVNMAEEMTAHVPLEFTGESDAVKVLNGTLMKVMDDVEVECLPTDLPPEILVDLSVLKTFDDAITVKDLKLPPNVKVTNDPENTIAFVEAPLTEEELKKREESQVGDVEAVQAEGEAKEGEAAEGEEAPREAAAVEEGATHEGNEH
jgi:large subunit ribosomal protein L25